MTMKKLVLTLVFAVLPTALLLISDPPAKAQPAARYAVAVTPTPVLNTPDFKKFFGGSLQLDPCKGVRPIEFVALAGTLFKVEAEMVKDGVTVYRVTSNDYPYRSEKGYFVDARSVQPVEGAPQERPRTLPGLAEVQRRLTAALGKPYVWGGNVKDGLPFLRKYYPQGDPLAGVDCSGLLYEATDGFTPRNTSALTAFGTALPVAGLSAQQIAAKLQPLDLIVWKGHVMIVLDGDSLIESTMGCEGGIGGVHLSPLPDALRRLMKHRQPLDMFPQGAAGAKGFVVRRWFTR
jgi:hypothetical protein